MKYGKVDPATGAASPGFSRGSDKYAKNQWSGHSNDGRLVNFKRGPTTGNDGTCHDPSGGPSVTKDKYRAAPTDAMPSKMKYSNPDYINGGAQVRGSGSTNVKKPSNIDRINVSGYSMGDGKVTKGSRPVATGQMDNVNYGPKKQY
jgi:hypothetical protein